jgi:hypothetical protein
MAIANALAVKGTIVQLPLLVFLMLVLHPPVQRMLVEHSFRQVVQHQEALEVRFPVIQVQVTRVQQIHLGCHHLQLL